MYYVRFTDWREGLRKISLTQLFQEYANLRLAPAKAATDRILDGEVVLVGVESLADAEGLVREATEVGAVCEIVAEE